MRNINEIKAEISVLRNAYEARVAVLHAEIDGVRKARGFVSTAKQHDELYYEPGRSTMPTPSGGMGAQ